ncbi:hypothetical protein PO909_025618 [Leuciscus waleckii]
MTEVEAQSMWPCHKMLYAHRSSPLMGFCATTEYMDTVHHHMKKWEMQDAAALEDEETILVDQLKKTYFNKSQET